MNFVKRVSMVLVFLAMLALAPLVVTAHTLFG
jgi:hypothetical protein